VVESLDLTLFYIQPNISKLIVLKSKMIDPVTTRNFHHRLASLKFSSEVVFMKSPKPINSSGTKKVFINSIFQPK